MVKKIIIWMFLIVNILETEAQKYYYISDAGNFQQGGPYQILRYNEDGSNGKVFIKDGLEWPQDILFLNNKNQVLVSNLKSNSVDAFDSATGELLGRFISGIEGPTRMRVGKDGMLYILQWRGDGKVKKYDLNGNFVDNATQTGIVTSIGFDWDKNDDLYVSSYNGRFIERFDKTGKSKGKFISTGLFGPTNIQFDQEGNLVVLDYNRGRVLLYDKDGKLIKTLITGAPQCEGIHLTPDGNFVIGTAASVRIYDKNNTIQKYLVPTGEHGLLNPNAVVYRDMSTLNAKDQPQKTDTDFLKYIGENKYIASSNLEILSNVTIYNYEGKVVKVHNFMQNDSLDMSAMHAGIYFAHTVLSVNKEAIQKLVVVQ